MFFPAVINLYPVYT